MKIKGIIVFIIVFLTTVLGAFSEPGEEVKIKEDFKNLDNWEAYEFPKIKEHSLYTIVEGDILKTESKASASAIIYKGEFDVYQYPLIEWKWKVDNIIKKGDAKSKEGDDYSIRIYIAFKYDPEKAGFGKRIKYNTAKLLYGDYPPDSSLNYIWANKNHEEDIIANAYTDQAQMILLQKGDADVGVWKNEEVDIVKDYRRAFGKEPPSVASIIIMNDTDNTGERAVSYVDYIKVYNEK
ncbi:DUF3047 domain-containing protein [uncultured Ilyobacter sp.]|uniref:DUF3047 domain-containing protein n=1 Tax=uncultured Ilyobacter sp. TaxID=544433 RepID=UPI0029F47E63|nr:DUF3047 domain-containing protein [uncultured Ilyobacter sp.]